MDEIKEETAEETTPEKEEGVEEVEPEEAILEEVKDADEINGTKE